MKKAYKLANLECANCATKMEQDIEKIDGVESVNIAFMTSRIKLELNDDVKLEDILDKAQDIISSYERNCRIVR